MRTICVPPPQRLNEADAVFGPAADGGYALVGLRRAAPELFTGMHWSHDQVMALTRERLAALGLRHVELPVLHDIDEPADLVSPARAMAALMSNRRGRTGPMTRRCCRPATRQLRHRRARALVMTNAERPGRNCPLHYRYSPSDLAVPASSCCEVLYVVGGLYGNMQALHRVLDLFELERGDKRLIFNGDFHWFDIDASAFAQIQRGVLAVRMRRAATRGNRAALRRHQTTAWTAVAAAPIPIGWAMRWSSVRTESSRGCAAPHARCPAPAANSRCCRCGGASMSAPRRVAVVHGDAQSLSGWGFAQETLRVAGQQQLALQWFEQARVDFFASSHTCLPVFQGFEERPRNGAALIAPLVLNNGAAGMPNLAGAREGLLTRIATRPFERQQRRFGLQARRAAPRRHRDRL